MPKLKITTTTMKNIFSRQSDKKVNHMKNNQILILMMSLYLYRREPRKKSHLSNRRLLVQWVGS